MIARRALYAALTVAGVSGAVACSAILGIDDRTLDPGVDGGTDGTTTDAPGADTGPSRDGNVPESGGGDSASPVDGGDAGACGDTTSDTHNCGRCGHDCLGGACMASACQPVALVPSSAGARPWHLAQDANNLYWTDYVNNTVSQTDKKTGQTIVLWNGAGQPLGITADDAGVYFGDAYGVYRCAIGGCNNNPLVLTGDASINQAYYVQVDDNGVYWNEAFGGEAVHRIPKTGGTFTDIYNAGDAGVYQLVSDGQFLYMGLDNGEVVRFPTDGGASTVLNASLTPVGANQLALDTNNVYWTQVDPSNGGPGTVNVVGKDAQAPRTIIANQLNPVGVAADGQSVYWTTQGTGADFKDGSIWSCPLTGCTMPTMLATHLQQPTEIVVDAQAIYWVTYGNGADDAGGVDGTVTKLAKP